MVSRQRFRESRWGGPGTALVAILGGAAALRLVGLKYGLPFGFLDPDETQIVPRSWRVVHGGGADPHWFRYPSLLLYLLAPFQSWQEVPSYFAARIVVLVLGLAAVGAAWLLGRRAYGVAAGAVAAAVVAVETTHVAYSRIAAPDVPLTLGIAVTLALLIAGRVEWAALAAGLSTGIAYPGFFLLVPLVVAVWGQWRRLAISLAIGFVAFCVATPFVLVDLGRAAEDGWRAARDAPAWARSGSSTTIRRRSHSSPGSGMGWGRC